MPHPTGEEAYRLPRFARQALRARFRWEIPEFFNLSVDTVERWARRTPEREALVEPGGRTLTYGALADLAARLSAVFAARGIGKGDVVGVLVPPSVEAALAHLSLYRLGAIVLPLSPVFGEAALRYRLEHSGAKALIVGRRSLDVHETLFRTAGVDAWPADRLPAWAEEARPANPAATRADDPALLVYTSGTTGPPKGALLPHRVLLGHLPGFYLYSNFPQFPARYWSPAEWAWVGGLLDVLFPAWFYGFTVIAYRAPKFDPEAAFRLLETYAVTHTFLFPTALKMMRASGYRPKRLALQSVHAGGEPLDPELQAWSAETFGLPINEFYGQTEANLLIGHCHPVDPLRPGSMGLAYPGHEVVLLDESGAPVSPGTVGEIALRLPDPVAFLGYWKNDAATAEKTAGGFLRTGDLAVRDEEGYFWFRGRKDDIINAAGYRLGPHDIESALLRHPAVAMAAAIGVPDPVRGERVAAYVQLVSGAKPTEALASALKALVRNAVGHHAVPGEIRFVEALPLTPTGKLMRHVLRAEARARAAEAGEAPPFGGGPSDPNGGEKAEDRA